VQAPIASVAQPINTRKDSTVNYEVDKTIRHTKQSLGTIKRLSAAIVVNHRKDAKGIAKPLSDAELKQINDLAKEAMGFSRERGDTVSVANAPFTAVEKNGLEVPIWKDPEYIALFKDLLKYAGIALIIAFLMLKIIVPLTRAMLPPPVEETPPLGSSLDVVAGEEEETQEELPPTAAEELARKLEAARELAKADPQAVANIIKDWMGANG
jgi:flagellar M-ring protein FliF